MKDVNYFKNKFVILNIVAVIFLILLGIGIIKKYPKTALVLFILALLLFFLFIRLMAKVSNEYDKREEQKLILKEQTWNSINLGDSIFFNKSKRFVDFYKKGKRELKENEQAELNYTEEYEIKFFKQNEVHEKLLYNAGSSYIGICIGKDSADGTKMVKIRPNKLFLESDNINPFGYDKTKWNNESKTFKSDSLGEFFYVPLDLVSTQDSI